MNTKNIAFILLIAGCIAFTIFVFQPGYLNNDAIDQLGQARSGQYSDWHPPVMSWLWRQLDMLAPGALGMFILQTLLYWIGLGLLISLATPHLLTRSLLLLTGFFPPLFMFLSAVVKDLLMAVVFLFGFGLIILAGQRKSVPAFIIGILFLAFGMLTRHNALLAAFPMFLYAGLVFIRFVPMKLGKRTPIWQAGIAGTVFFLAAFLIGQIWSNSLTKVKTYPVQQIMLHDLAGISIKLKTYLIPDYLAISEQPSMRDLRHLYNVRALKNLYWPDFTSIHYRMLTDSAEVDTLTNIWFHTVLEYPRAYLDHRWKVFLATASISVHKSCGPYYYEETVYKPKGYYQDNGGYYSDNPVTDRIFALVEPLRESPLYWNWVYALLTALFAIASLPVLWKVGIAKPSFAAASFALSGGASMYALANLFVAVACDFRYYHWNVVAALVSAIFLFNAWKEKETVTS